MSVLGRLASALGRNDERPNVELAEALVGKPDKAAIAELAGALASGTVAQQNDAIKVLYEIGERAPELIADHAAAFLALLSSKNNRNVWGALSAIDTIAAAKPRDVAKHLDAILAAADRGSVIARDKAMSILAKLAASGHEPALPLLLDRLRDAAPNQFPLYAELTLPVIDKPNAAGFRAILETRLKAIPQPAKRTRIEKLLKKLGKTAA